MLRRAAVFGLRRVNTPWALIALHRRTIEDDQWYVRSAAEQAFQEMQFGDIAAGVRSYPPIESIPWLREWITSLGQEAGEAIDGDSSALLRKALEEGSPLIQSLSAANMGQLGLAAYTGLLYTTLRHRDSEVREAAHRALCNIQLQMGYPLPSPI
jgi:HEAT repeat protein